MTDTLRDLLILHEGMREATYYDSLGFVTGGVGCLLDPRRGAKLPRHIWEQILDFQIEEHRAALRTALPWVSGLSPVRQAVLDDMVFNLGVSGLLGFHNMLEAAKSGRYVDAAGEMYASKWATQVGDRAKRLGGMMKSGNWP